MHPNEYRYLTLHARERILQRADIDPEWVEAAVRGKRAIKIGSNPDDDSTDLLVFYNPFSNSHYILVQSRDSERIITILFQDSQRWQVDPQIVARSRERMEELLMIRGIKQEWTQERKPSPPASIEQIRALVDGQD